MYLQVVRRPKKARRHRQLSHRPTCSKPFYMARHSGRATIAGYPKKRGLDLHVEPLNHIAALALVAPSTGRSTFVMPHCQQFWRPDPS